MRTMISFASPSFLQGYEEHQMLWHNLRIIFEEKKQFRYESSSCNGTYTISLPDPVLHAR